MPLKHGVEVGLKRMGATSIGCCAFFCAIRGVIGDCYCILCNLLVLITGLDG